jgi:hypothetical protein
MNKSSLRAFALKKRSGDWSINGHNLRYFNKKGD